MNILAILGIKGGVGATTVTANIAAALQKHGKKVLALDLCPQNHLRYYFGLPWEEEKGIVTQISQYKHWYEVCFKSHSGIHFIPFGEINSSYSLQKLSTQTNDYFLRIRSDLAMLDFPEDSWLIVDCPGGYNVAPWREQMISHADLILKVCTTDPLCYAMTKGFGDNNEPAVIRSDKIEENILINQYCPTITLDRDIHDLLQAEQSNNLVPIAIHKDENVREALAFKKTVFDCAPYSQACQDFSHIATWLIAQDVRHAKY